MEKKEINNPVRLFFGKRFSKETQLYFRYWFRLDEDSREKETRMQELWEESPEAVTPQTWESLEKLKDRIAAWQPSHRHFLIPSWVKYAAAVLLIVASSWITRRMSLPEKEIVSAELVEVYVPYGDCREVMLADGSKVWVNAGSLLIYPVAFNGSKRTVYLNGEARFEVAKNPAQPFTVNTHYLDIQALGTVFSVQAYPNASVTSTTLEEGSIQVDTKQVEPASSIVLKPNEQLVYTHNTRQISVSQIDAARMAAWKDGYLIFEHASFGEVVAALERKYDVTINYNAKKFQDCSYFVKINPDETVQEALRLLSHLEGNFEFTITGKTISIH